MNQVNKKVQEQVRLFIRKGIVLSPSEKAGEYILIRTTKKKGRTLIQKMNWRPDTSNMRQARAIVKSFKELAKTV